MAQQKDSKHRLSQRFWLGLSNLLKEPSSKDPNQPSMFYYAENINIRTDPYAPTLNFATVKESGGTVTDFVKWADITPEALTVYLYGDTGNIYSRTSAGSWTNLHTAPSSHGNGLQYFYGDDYVYYPTDTAIGRYGPIGGTPTFTDDFLTAVGGIPQNTNSLTLVAASSQYATAADSASLEITSDLTLEAYFYATTLPAAASSMTLVGKWDESGALRSYVMDIYGISGYFGDGSSGPLTISSNTTEAPIDSACSGTAGAYVLTATNVSFAVGQRILIHQTQGTNAGQYERNVISGYTAGTITLQTPLVGSYTTGAQVRVTPQYTNVTVNNGFTYSAKAWNGTVGGILSFLSNGTVSVSGSISADGTGFRGGSGNSNSGTGYSGESGLGLGASAAGGTAQTTVNGGGGQGGGGSGGSAGGGGGGHGSAGSNCAIYAGRAGGAGGTTYDSADLSTMTLGSGGGGANQWEITYPGPGGNGGAGGGVVFIIGATITVAGTISANGAVGQTVSSGTYGGGGGAGGAILLKSQTATLGASLVSCSGGAGGTSTDANAYYGSVGGAGGVGYIVLDYLTSYTGTTTPTLNPIQDNTLVTTTTYQARLGISSNGTALEYLTQNFTSLSTGQWYRLSISWKASTSVATFYLNGSSFGTATGTKTSISSNASLLYVGAKKGASVVGSFLDGIIDDVRVWGSLQSASSIFTNCNHQLSANTATLKAYYELNGVATDTTTNANDLTLQGSPSYTTSVPFVDPTTRLDIDQSYTTTGSTYTLPTAISESAANTLPFTPTLDPQKSMAVNVDTKGTGNWTITIHDQANTVIATKTIANASMPTGGYQEFIWTSPWRIVIGKSYHAHITVSTGTSKIVSSSLNTLQSNGSAVADYYTYYQYLVSDTFHPVSRWLNFLVIGNERYIAKWDGAFYSANLLAFPAGTHVRCLGTWGTYLAIGTWQEASSGTPNVYDFPIGKIYFWDGIALTFNFAIDVPEGQVNAIYGMDSDLYYVAGWKGDLMYYQGSWINQSGSFNGAKIKRFPLLESSSYVEVFPQGMANYQGLLYMGVSANSNSTTFARGIYSWGALYPDYPKSLSYEHIISTNNNSSTVSVGMVYPVGQKLLCSWKDGISYGVDIVDPTAGKYHTSGRIQTNLQDGGDIYSDELLLKVRADHLGLNTGEGIQVGYKKDREASFELSGSITDALLKKTTNAVSNGRLNEFQIEAVLTGNGTSSPTLLGASALWDSLDTEDQF